MQNSDEFSDSVLVVGGGIAGIQAALDLADSNRKVIMVERSPSIGGRMAQLDKTFPTNDCSMCILAPKLIAVNRHKNISLLTNSEVLGVDGEAGNFDVRIKRKARYIDEVSCIGCGVCAENCPVIVPSEFNQLLGERRAAYIPFPQAVPLKFALDRRDPSPCKVSCPANLSAQGYVALIAQGRYKEALAVVKDVMPFAGTIGRVCDHKCETSCKRGDYEGSVAIRTLKRFLADWERDSEEEVKPTMLAEPNGRKIAIVGGGCAGLTCAYHLARLGYSPTVFEAQPVTGGMLRLGIPDYRLPPESLQAEIDAITKQLGVEIKTGMRAGVDFEVKDLMEKDGYEAVFLAVGLHNSMKLGVPGEDAEGVMHGVEFLRAAALKEDLKLGEKVIVIGGGNVAVDVARTARRLGVKKVDMVCLESRDEMPAHSWEIEEAEEEGIEVHNSWGPREFIVANDKVTGVELKSCTSVFDSDGKFCPEYDEAQRQTMDADNVLVAIGQAGDLDFLKGFVDVSRGIDVNDDLSTKVPGVFAGGDATYGPKMAIDAIASGRKAAWEIDKYLHDGKNFVEPPLLEVVDIDKADYYKPTEIKKEERHKLSLLSPDDRVSNFNEIESCYSEEEAKAEADRCLSCGVCARCGVCEIVCEPKSIRYRDTEKEEAYKVGSVVVAPGYECFDPSTMTEYGYEEHKDVVTALEFERILSASGPFAGHIKRLSDGKDPKKLAFIQCVGSRDRNHGNPYCSSVCCMYTIKEAVIAKEHSPELDITVYFMDIRAFGKEFDYYYKRAVEEVGINFIRSRVSSIGSVEGEDGSQYRLNYVGEDDDIKSDDFDMVVLSTGLIPNRDTVDFANRVGLELNHYNFCDTNSLAPLSSSREGVFVCGAFSEPKDIPETIAEASGAAGTAMLYSVPQKFDENAEAKGAAQEKVSPDVMAPEAEPRVGVIVCNCGINIGKVVNVPGVAEYAKSLPGVVVAEGALYSCSQDTQEKIKKMILEHKLNRVVVASCTPRTHEPLFQETLKEVGLNPYLFELVNIREHCSWVHMYEEDKATAKAKDLVRKACARVGTLEPLEKVKLPIVKNALVLGGGPAGMTAASALAGLGYRVHLFERTGKLGGNLKHIHTLPSGEDPQAFLADLSERVARNSNIQVYLNTEVSEISGHIGHFTSSFSYTASEGGERRSEDVEDGVIIVATGGDEYKPKEFLYNESDSVLLQREFEKKLVSNDINAKSVAMIQCVGSRSDEYGWCSRVCCTEAVKNALDYKRRVPDGEVTILYKDVRTYGFKEDYYEEASRVGIRFVRYDDDAPPRLEAGDDGKLRLFINDKLLGEDLELNPDLCVLSAGIHPNPTNPELAEMLKVPVSRDGFFLEAHMKLRPVDFYTEGVFLCGLAHSPKTLSESLAQAYAAVARANTVLSHDDLELGGIVASVEIEKCAACLTCVRACPFQVPVINEQNVAHIEIAKCQGCGVCVAECPAKAIQLAHFKDHQILAETDALLLVAEEVEE